jgi:hypothetical protein
MKAYLFIETGEVRTPKVGEYFINCLGNPHSNVAYEDPAPSPILARHVIRLADGTAGVYLESYKMENGQRACYQTHGTFDIPRPKRKVRKWRFLMRDSCGDFYLSPFVKQDTEAYRERRAMSDTVVMRLDDTMREVEEP